MKQAQTLLEWAGAALHSLSIGDPSKGETIKYDSAHDSLSVGDEGKRAAICVLS